MNTQDLTREYHSLFPIAANAESATRLRLIKLKMIQALAEQCDCSDDELKTLLSINDSIKEIELMAEMYNHT